MKKQQQLRRSGAKIMASLILLLGSLSYIMILAVLNGSLGFVSAMGSDGVRCAGRGKGTWGKRGSVLRLDYRACYRMRRTAGNPPLF